MAKRDAVNRLTKEIREGPTGPKIGAFFDLDHTLLAGSHDGLVERVARRQRHAVDELDRPAGFSEDFLPGDCRHYHKRVGKCADSTI